MTEQQFQEARKIMKTANWLRGEITSAKGDVARWTTIESAHRSNLKEAQADGAKKMLDKAMQRLEKTRKRLADLKLPTDDFKTNTKWIAAIDTDSFNMEPKEIGEDLFTQAKCEGLTLYDSRQACQSVCDQENSL